MSQNECEQLKELASELQELKDNSPEKYALIKNYIGILYDEIDDGIPIPSEDGKKPAIKACTV